MKKLFVITLALVLVIGMTGMVLAAGNDATVEQDNSEDTNADLEAFVKQVGYSNLTEVEQITDGQDHYADVFQEGNHNDAQIVQGTGGASYGWKEANITQIGNYNFADIDQPYRNALGDITQDGDNNEATMYQYNNKPNHQDSGWGAKGLIEQDGNGNFADVYQHVTSYQKWSESGAEIFQLGDNNIAEQTLTGGINNSLIWQFGDRNNATGEATGDFNEIYVLQGLEQDLPGFVPGFIPSAQGDGNDNTAYVYQEGDSNLAGIGQFGNDNNSEVEQHNDNNLFITIQEGTDNHVKGVDENDYNLTFNMNKPAKQFNGAIFASYQEGDGNEIGLRQGEDDTGLILQDGNDNQALLNQFGGADHFSLITQTGDNNTAEVCQN